MYTKYKEYIYGLLWMLISPAIALFISFRQADRKLKRWMLILFTTIFGSTFIIGGDAIRHQALVNSHYVGLSFAQFMSETKSILLFQAAPNIPNDLYIHIISYLVGGVLALPGLFFVIVGFVYGYFFSGSMFRLFEAFPKFHEHKLFWGLAVIFIMRLSLTSMETVRTWTGFWILFYACISYYQTHNKKFLFLMLVPPFVHFAYFVMAIPAWIVAVAGNWKKTFSILFVVSFFTLLITPQITTSLMTQTELGQNKVQSYKVNSKTSVEEHFNALAGSRLYNQYMKSGITYSFIALIAFTLIVFGTYFRSFNALESSLFSIGLLMKVFSNTLWYILALSKRLDIIASLFILAAVILFLQRHYLRKQPLQINNLQRGLLWVSIIGLLPIIVYQTAKFTNYASAFLLIFPFVPWISGGINLPLAKALPIREIIGFFI